MEDAKPFIINESLRARLYQVTDIVWNIPEGLTKPSHLPSEGIIVFDEKELKDMGETEIITNYLVERYRFNITSFNYEEIHVLI